MKREFESIEWDSNKNCINITKQQTLTINEANNLEEAKTKLKWRLRGIVAQVKELKKEAEEIKIMLMKLEGKAGPIDPAL
jgi:hypothetical protein